MKLSQILLPVLFLGILGCGTTEPSECDSLLGLETTSGTAPLFTWSSTCAVHSILVLDAADRHLWRIAAADSVNAIFSPVTYGIVPSGAAQVGPLGSIHPGFRTRVIVEVARGGGIHEVADVVFVP